jgi:hypothetical protein
MTTAIILTWLALGSVANVLVFCAAAVSSAADREAERMQRAMEGGNDA